MAPLKADELLKHAEYKTVIWSLKPTSEGDLPVARGRGGPFNIHYEIHGHGPIHLVFLMGLGGFIYTWQRQTKYFGHDEADKYSCLVFDNRGIGKSDKPLMRYSTSDMAKDTIEILDHVGWTSQRELHVVGVSMGGMIAQELAYAIPDRIKSLTLLSTAARLVNTVGYFENLRNRINMFFPKDIDTQIAEAKGRLFSKEWLEKPDAEGTFPTNGDRFAAQELYKRLDKEGFTRKGFILQAIAAGWHNKSAKQLNKIANAVGRDRIQVIHGTIDPLITVPHGEVLVMELGGEEKGITRIIIENGSHALIWEQKDGINSTVSQLVDKTEALK